eukprot:COSAG01_NODE_29866_length_628_cov_0.516068_2_plen_20_part_01
MNADAISGELPDPMPTAVRL